MASSDCNHVPINSLCPLHSFAKCNQVRLDRCIDYWGKVWLNHGDSCDTCTFLLTLTPTAPTCIVRSWHHRSDIEIKHFSALTWHQSALLHIETMQFPGDERYAHSNVIHLLSPRTCPADLSLHLHELFKQTWWAEPSIIPLTVGPFWLIFVAP